MEKTFVLLKPDAVQKGRLGAIVSRFEEKGLKLVAAKLIQLNDKMLDEHYAQYVGKSFFPRLKEFMSSTPVLAMVWEGVDVVKVVRVLCGATNGREATPGTIRGDYSMSIQSNLIHASDSLETANKEIARFFSKNEVLASFKKVDFDLSYADDEKKM